MTLVYGILKSAKNGQASVSVAGYEGDAVLDAVLLLPGGSHTVKTWIPPVAGDQVAVLVDDEHPEDSLVLGGVYTDAQSAPKDGSRVAIQAPEVWLGDDVAAAQKAARDDHVQAELAAIKAALDALVEAFNVHTHQILLIPKDDASAIATAAAAPGAAPAVLSTTYTSVVVTPAENPYTVKATAADSVWVK